MKLFFLPIKKIILLSILICGIQNWLDAKVGTYMHDAQLMQLVHGEFKGTLLWVWDASMVRHPFTTVTCAAAIAYIIAYKCSSIMNKNLKSIVAAIRASIKSYARRRDC